MAAYEVRQLMLRPERHEHLLGCDLDTPSPGARGDTHVLHVVGWVVGRDQAVSEVVVRYRGHVVKSSPVRGDRPDVAAAISDIPPDTECAFHVLLGLVGLDPDVELELEALLADGTCVPIGAIALRRGAVQSGLAPTLQPLMLTCLGRTGSTWVMKLLATHPQVVAYRRHPFESAPAKYWMHMLRVLSAPGDMGASAHPDTFDQSRSWVGQNPFHDESVYERPPLAYCIGRDYVERLAAFCQHAVEDWYMTVAASQEQDAPALFAEKHIWPHDLQSLAWELYPGAKEIFLVRDFRDVACSILAYDRRRGFPGFGRPDGISDEQYLRGDLRRMALELRASWEARSERAHLLRYEDLVTEPHETLTALLGYLELDASPSTIDRMLEIGQQASPALPGLSIAPASLVDAHRTTEDLRASIGRWSREPDGDVRRLCGEVFGEALSAFGYA